MKRLLLLLIMTIILFSNIVTLKAQPLDIKWVEKSLNDNINLAVKMAVCMANGGGGTVVFGIRDKVKGRKNAIIC